MPHPAPSERMSMTWELHLHSRDVGVAHPRRRRRRRGSVEGNWYGRGQHDSLTQKPGGTVEMEKHLRAKNG